MSVVWALLLVTRFHAAVAGPVGDYASLQDCQDAARQASVSMDAGASWQLAPARDIGAICVPHPKEAR